MACNEIGSCKRSRCELLDGPIGESQLQEYDEEMLVRGTGNADSECRIFFSMAENKGRCVMDEANTVVPSGDRWPYTMQLGATAKQCLLKCLREKNLPISRPNVYGCEYQSFVDGATPPKCEAITEDFQGSEELEPPAGGQTICWTLLTRQTIADHLKIHRNPYYCRWAWHRKGCVRLK